jgi:hypothetical protein
MFGESTLLGLILIPASPVCEKRFNRPSSLNTHMSVHTGAKRESYSLHSFIHESDSQHTSASARAADAVSRSAPTCGATNA